VIRPRHVVKLGETLFDSGARLVVLGRFHCSRQGDVRTPGMDFTPSVYPPSLGAVTLYVTLSASPCP
jgi:hypothetical protein